MARDFPVKDTLRANLRANFKLSNNFHILLNPIQIHGRGNVLFCPNIFNAIEQHLLILAGRWILRMNMYEMEREKKVLKIWQKIIIRLMKIDEIMKIDPNGQRNYFKV